MSLAIEKEELDWEVVGIKGGEGGVNGPVGVVIVDDGMQASVRKRRLLSETCPEQIRKHF